MLSSSSLDSDASSSSEGEMYMLLIEPVLLVQEYTTQSSSFRLFSNLVFQT